MPEVVVFGDAEAAARTWLNPRLTPVKVSTQVPAVRPAELVKVSLTGGSEPNRVTDQPVLTFECWAPTSTRAAEICQLVRAHLRAMEGATVNGVFVRRVRQVGGPVSFPDPESDSPRYQYTAELNCRFVSAGGS